MTARPERMTVLVVDDNAENRALAMATLDDEGIACLCASSGEEAISIFEREHPDCILLDIRMPGLDGVATCHYLRALPGGDAVAIVFVTAERDVATFDRALRAGGDDFVTKPFRPSELVVRLDTAMRLRRMTSMHDQLAVELKHQRDELLRLQLHKEQLSQFLVHDLKNPVNAIQLQAQRVLRDASPDTRSFDAAQKIDTEARALMRMITNLLDLGRADEGRLAPVRQPVSVGELVADVVSELRMRADAAEVSLVARAAAIEAAIDRDLVHRVLANLIDNAIRHAPERTAITISAHGTTRGVELRVSDEGPGVPPEQREQVFERFLSTGGPTNRGLGLAFCRVAVEAHGGSIWVEDAHPGAAFCLELPGS